MKIIKNLAIPDQNKESHEIHRIPGQNNEHHENLIITRKKTRKS